MRLDSINTDQRLYVMPCAGGFSCYGFDVLDAKAAAVAAWLGVAAPTSTPGTREHFQDCADVMASGALRHADTGARCPADLTPALIGLEGWRVEVLDAYGERRRFIVGKSTGWMPCHLEIARRNSSGGGAVTGAPFQSLRKLEKVR
jgi:hypothetical protein